MTPTPIIDKAILFIRIWITQLGVGFPESGGAYLTASDTLDRIADAMTANLATSLWEGPAATANSIQGLAQRNSVAKLELVDRELAATIAEQAVAVSLARASFRNAETYLMKEARPTAESLYATAGVAASTQFEWTAVTQANREIHEALNRLNAATLENTTRVGALHPQLDGIEAILIGNGTSTHGGASTTVATESADLLKAAASKMRVDLLSLRDVAAFCRVTQAWMRDPIIVTSAVSQRVGTTHGHYTAAFTDALRLFELRRAAIVERLRAAVAGRAAQLEHATAHFEGTDDEAAWLLDALSE